MLLLPNSVLRDVRMRVVGAITASSTCLALLFVDWAKPHAWCKKHCVCHTPVKKIVADPETLNVSVNPDQYAD